MTMGRASGETIGRYALLERIGAGGMGEVWRVEHVGPHGVRRRAALKRILDAYQNDRTLRERFIAEARITARLEHPNIVQLLDFGETPEPHLVLEYVEGVSVLDLMRKAASDPSVLPLNAALFIAAEAASGLDYAHRRTDDQGRPFEIVHRDVSPGNVLVSIDGAVKVGDFGVARAADNVVRTTAGLAIGKIRYMAPEQAAGGAIDHRADLFALGIVLWEMLTRRPLIPRGEIGAAFEALLRCDFAPPSSVSSGIPPALDDLVRRMLAHDPSQRPASAARVSQELRAILASLDPSFDRRRLSGCVRACAPERFGRVPMASEPALPAMVPPMAAAPPVPPMAAPPAAAPALPAPSPMFASPPIPQPTPAVRAPASRSPIIVAAVAGVVLLALAGVAVLWRGRSAVSQSARSQGSPPIGSSNSRLRRPRGECDQLAACCLGIEEPFASYDACRDVSTQSASWDDPGCAGSLARIAVRRAALGAPVRPACGVADVMALQQTRCASIEPCCRAILALPESRLVRNARLICPEALTPGAAQDICSGVLATFRTYVREVPSDGPLPAACQ